MKILKNIHDDKKRYFIFTKNGPYFTFFNKKIVKKTVVF
ncbi:hypothetical protein FH5_00384 [Priestia endophytica]|nr:hypothetical protein FH5_00384 [Priestia endophytica]